LTLDRGLGEIFGGVDVFLAPFAAAGDCRRWPALTLAAPGQPGVDGRAVAVPRRFVGARPLAVQDRANVIVGDVGERAAGAELARDLVRG
jgi:hypothetical protein